MGPGVKRLAIPFGHFFGKLFTAMERLIIDFISDN
jgi:hypothetical protein